MTQSLHSSEYLRGAHVRLWKRFGIEPISSFPALSPAHTIISNQACFTIFAIDQCTDANPLAKSGNGGMITSCRASLSVWNTMPCVVSTSLSARSGESARISFQYSALSVNGGGCDWSRKYSPSSPLQITSPASTASFAHG